MREVHFPCVLEGQDKAAVFLEELQSDYVDFAGVFLLAEGRELGVALEGAREGGPVGDLVVHAADGNEGLVGGDGVEVALVDVLLDERLAHVEVRSALGRRSLRVVQGAWQWLREEQHVA